MKLIIFALCCFILSTYFIVEGGLVKDFFGKIKETAEVVHKDVKQIWRPESDNTNKNNTEKGDNSVTPITVVPSAAEVGQAEIKEDSKVTEKSSTENEKKTDDSVTPNLTTPATEDKKDKQEETTTVSTSTTTAKEGRENFTGGCQTGYKRTADGRCMATF